MLSGEFINDCPFKKHCKPLSESLSLLDGTFRYVLMISPFEFIDKC